ncbi:hypothetical protein RBU60_07995 [Mesonia sp. MT50]|uniref:tRNA (Guanine-N1)-methyltransferase n=1 Tax=Mesonia profundi TaxID=3070998 RepID=A0ABU1A1C9_9FLAO|nr:hypothetical protein [Mesonia profundi]MDQ7917512.1 hypothetical protein [Mesonia profundi]
MKKSFFSFFLVLLLSGSVFAQEEVSQEKEKDNSINAQFTEMIDDANNYQEYKVVKQFKLTQLQKNTVQELESLNKTIKASSDTIQNQRKEIAKLQQKLDGTNEDLASITQEKDDIQFLGVATNKGSYQTTMWVIILTLVLILLFFIYKFKNSNVLTKEARKNLAENEADFEEFRKMSLEKQQKLGRMLQDEKNKQANKS